MPNAVSRAVFRTVAKSVIRVSPACRGIASLAVSASAIAVTCGASAQAPIVRPFEDEVIYQIMPIAWRDSNLDVTGSVQTRFGDF
ncbi:MAG: hypothetical protein RL354_351, partial [Planctomycetota bacterium]